LWWPGAPAGETGPGDLAEVVWQTPVVHASDPGPRTIGELPATVLGLLVTLFWWIILIPVVGAVVAAVGALVDEGVGSSAGRFLLVGLVLAAPGVAGALWWAVGLSFRLVGPRRGRIELDGDDLVIHDRWLLREPIRLGRNEVVGAQRSGGRREARGSKVPTLMADVGWASNVRLDLSTVRSFPEAVRTPMLSSEPDTISRGRQARQLLLWLRDPDRFVHEVTGWASGSMPEADEGTRRSRRDSIIWGAWSTATVVGFVLMLIGLDRAG
jgi:hypothetical protein